MATNCTFTVPYTSEFLSDLTSISLVLIITTGIATLFTLVFSVRTLWLVYRNTENIHERYICWILAALCPVVGVTSYTGLISPRSALVSTLVSSIYVAVTVGLFFHLIMLYMDGEAGFYKTLKGIKLPYGKPPFCCCVCLRNVNLTRKTLNRTKLLVYQSVVLRPIILYAESIVTMEDTVRSASLADHPGRLVALVFNGVSTILSLMGLITTFQASVKLLKDQGIILKFIHLNLVMVLVDPQVAIIGMIVGTGVLPCSHIFYHPETASTLKNILLCYEMMLISILGLKAYGKKAMVAKNKKVESQPKGIILSGYNLSPIGEKMTVEGN